MMKLTRIIAAFMAAVMFVPAVCAIGEEDDFETTDEMLAESAELDAEDTDDITDRIGAQYQEKNLEDFDMNSPAIYTCRILPGYSLFTQRDTKSKKIRAGQNKAYNAEILYVGVAWLVVRSGNYIGYINRQYVTDVTPLDSVNTKPYGVQKHMYVATTKTECPVYKSMDHNDEAYLTLNSGTMLSVWQFLDGWAVVNYHKTYGYIDPDCLTDMFSVSPTDEPLSPDMPIAAYTSYYSMKKTESNLNRIVNISVGVSRISVTLNPGESYDCNKQMGPYKRVNGYLPAPVLINGTSVPGYGGGTCQVSSTLYNSLLQLPGITILKRRPHGPAGASYLPHGVDAAVGNESLNLIFRNDYDFPIRIEGHTSGDGALLFLIYKVQ